MLFNLAYFSHENLCLLIGCIWFAGCSVVQPFISKIPLTKPPITPSIETSKDTYLDPIFPPIDHTSSLAASPLDTQPLKDFENTNASQLTAITEIVPQKLETTPPLPLVYSPLLLKYAKLLGQQVEELPDSNLLSHIDPWIGVRYLYGGNTPKGIDCSAFTGAVVLSYRGIQLPRISRDQYQFCEKITKDEVQVGDLLFFKTRGRYVSHVGIYLGNEKFVHASTTKGVTISDWRESYYTTRYVGAGRVPSVQGATK